MPSRQYRSTVEAKTLSTGITSGASSIIVNSVTTLPNSYPYTLVLDPDTNKEEIVTVTSLIGGNVLAVTRGQDGTSAQAHDASAVIKHMVTARDLQEPQDHIYANSNVHGVTSSVVGLSDAQTLTNKTLASPTLNTPKINENVALTATSTELNILDGATLTTTELNYVDGVTSAIQAQLDLLIPKGMLSPFAGSSAPTGWLLCNGTAVSRTTYSALFAVVGTTYGVGDNSTTFNLPDLLGRAPVGAGAGSGLTSRTLGTKLGAESTTLTSSHIPQHSHTIDHDHAAFNTTGGEGSHGHGINTAIEIAGSLANDTQINWLMNAKATDRVYVNTDAAGAHNHSIDVPNFTGSSGYYGTLAPTAVTAVQPSTVVNYIIKF